MKKVRLLLLWAAAMFVGRQLADALHELGHALVAVAVGGRVESIQPWAVLGKPITNISGLSNASQSLVDLSGALTMGIVSLACLFLLPWRKLSALAASSIAAFLLFFVAGSGAISFFAFSTGLNDASNFIFHSGANRHVVFVLSGGAFLALVGLFVSRTEVVSRVLEAFSSSDEQATGRPGHTTEALLASFFLLVTFALYGLPESTRRMQVGLAVLLDGVSIKNVDPKAEIDAGGAQVHYREEWFTPGLGGLKPGGTVELFYASFTNNGGATLPAEIYSPAEVRISAPGYSTHITGRRCGHWKDELTALDQGFAALERRRQDLKPDPAAKPAPRFQPTTITGDGIPPQVIHQPVLSFPTGKPLAITAQVRDPAGVKWVRVRYRSVNQHQDFLTLTMVSTGDKDQYRAVIPLEEIPPTWDLMYFIEAMDKDGNGCIHPDLSKETPYVVVKLQR